MEKDFEENWKTKSFQKNLDLVPVATQIVKSTEFNNKTYTASDYKITDKEVIIKCDAKEIGKYNNLIYHSFKIALKNSFNQIKYNIRHSNYDKNIEKQVSGKVERYLNKHFPEIKQQES